jgi:hypothetical protein
MMLLLRTQRTHTFLEEKQGQTSKKNIFLTGKDFCKKVCTLHKLRRYINSKRLDGKIAVITGGSSGVGLATAQRFVQEGAYVFIAFVRGFA